MTIGILRVPGKQLVSNKKEKLAYLRHRYSIEKIKWEKKMEIKSGKSDNNCSLIREGEDSIGTDGDLRGPPRRNGKSEVFIVSSIHFSNNYVLLVYYYVYIKEKSLNSRGGI